MMKKSLKELSDTRKIELKKKNISITRMKQTIREYCDANNPYKIGEKFTDDIGSIIIEKIRYTYTKNGSPCCIYFGTELKKDGTPKKKKTKRQAWQKKPFDFKS